jgi:phosphoserine phosphatase RsbU/P
LRIRRTIAARLIFTTVLGASLVFALALGIVHLRAREIIEAKVAESARNLAQGSLNRVEAVLDSVAKVTEGLAGALETGDLSERDIETLLRRAVEGNPEIFGAAVAFEPEVLSGANRRYAPYYYRSGGKIAFARLDKTVDYPLQDWYQIPRELGRPEWSEPYFDHGGGNTLMAAMSFPFYTGAGEKRRVKGVVTADIALDWLSDAIGAIKVLDTGYAFLLSRNGTVVAHPVPERIMNETIFSLAEARGDRGVREVGRRMVRGETGFVPYANHAGVLSRLYYAPVPSTGWTLAIVFPEAELFADIRRLTFTVAGIAAAGLLLLAGIVREAARSITQPLSALAMATKEISEGKFDAPFPSSSALDEVGTLSRAFSAMTVALREHIRRLVDATSARERIEGELRAAHDIQMSILPKMPPQSPSDKFELSAFLAPAKEVGGDFYDFFEIDTDRLCLVVADVSGKGVPAALFMAVAKTLIKAKARSGRGAAEILAEVNDEIARDNEQNMFVTVFCGVLDLNTGELTYANAGHNPPLLLSQGAAPIFLPVNRQPALGVMDGVSYRDQKIILADGDRLLLYTDGVTEAANLEGDFYTEERLISEANRLTACDVRTAVEETVASVHAFANGAEQADDITVMLLEYRGRRVPESPSGEAS